MNIKTYGLYLELKTLQKLSMNFLKILSFFVAVLFCVGFVEAQTSDRVLWAADNDLLPQNSVKAITPDKYGYLWLTTENGLVRYDGLNYKTYNSQNLKLQNNRMFFIEGNAEKDSLFISTNYAQDLILIHQREATKLDLSKFRDVTRFQTWNGNVYNSSGSLSINLNIHNYKISLPSKEYYLIKAKSVEYYTAKNQLLNTIPFEGSLTENIFTKGEKLYYFKDGGHYAVFNKGQIKWYKVRIPFSPDFKIIWNKSCEQAFISADNSLFFVKAQGSELLFNNIVTDKDLKLKSIVSAYYQVTNKILFLGSRTSGLGIYRPQGFKTLTYVDDKNSSVFYAIAPFDKETILTSAGFLMNKDTLLDRYNFRELDKLAMVVDKSKNIWLKLNNTLTQYQKGKNYEKFKTYDFTEYISTLFQVDENKIWIVLGRGLTNNHQLQFFSPGNNPVFQKCCALDFRVNYMAKGRNGQLWVAGSKGLYLLNEQTNLLKHVKVTAHLDIRSILITGPSEIWIATYGNGFYLYKNGRLHTFPLDKNGYLSTAHYFMEDKKGFFWIPTNKGLFQVKKDILLSYAKNSEQNIYYHFYNKDSGFLTNEFNGGSFPFSAQLGTQFFLPSMNGIVTFDTETIQPLEPKNVLYIDEITVDNLQIPIETVLKLPSSYQRATFHFSTPFYGNPLNSNYDVRLDGPTNLGWTALNQDHNYSFTKLSSGTYTLTTRMLTGFNSKYTYKKITIEIAPYFYETTSFLLTLGLLFFMLVYGSIKLYSNQIRRRNQYLLSKIDSKTKDLRETIGTLRATKDNMKKQADKNNKLIQIISHDIKSPLKFMSMASQYMYDDFDPNSPDLKENILALHTSSSQIYNFLDNVLSYSKVNTADGELENDHFILYDEIKDKIMFFKNIANSSKTELVNLVPPLMLLHTNKSLFAIIIHNLLDNALKHTLNGTVAFSVVQQDDEIEITINDTGIGMTAEVLHYYQSVFEDFDLYKNKSNKRLGLHLVAELMLVLNGKVRLNSKLGKGTTLILLFANQIEKESS
jgi:signal transduction histidine kinase